MTFSPSEAVGLIEKSIATPSAVSRGQLAEAIDSIVECTRLTYEQGAGSYEELRGDEISSDDLRMNRRLLDVMRKRIAQGLIRLAHAPVWRLLDVGAGYGRDAKFFGAEPDVRVSALENSGPFLHVLRRAAADGDIDLDQIIDADMRDLSMIAESAFECVRSYATLHHVPVVPYGLGADSAVSETRRILVTGGVFQCLVKQGSGIAMTDTGEGLGQRFYQYFTEDSLSQLLARHDLEPLDCATFRESRPAGDVEWIMMLAYAR
jgi:SAM-dependent methyltransferase